MAEITLDKSTTALLMADFSAGSMAQNPLVHERGTFARAGEVLAAARQAGIFRHLLHVPFPARLSRDSRPAQPAEPHAGHGSRAAGGPLPPPPSLGRAQGGGARHRQAPHQCVLRERVSHNHPCGSQGIATLILMGHATSGVTPSPCGWPPTLDYHVIVVRDWCADRDPDVHTLLMEKVFPRQATVVKRHGNGGGAGVVSVITALLWQGMDSKLAGRREVSAMVLFSRTTETPGSSRKRSCYNNRGV